MIMTKDPVTYAPIYSAIPTWLNFDLSTSTFYGIPTSSDYPPANFQFPIVLDIVILVTDTEELTAISNQ